MEAGADDILSLRRGLRDLLALTTLPAIWANSQPHDIAVSLSDVMLTTSRLDFVYIRFNEHGEQPALELVRTAQRLLIGEQAQTVGQSFTPLLTGKNLNVILTVDDPLSDEPLKIAVVPIGHEGRLGF